MKRRNFIVMIGALLNWRPLRTATVSLPDKTIRHLGEATRFGEPLREKLNDVANLLSSIKGLSYSHSRGCFSDCIVVRDMPPLARIYEYDMERNAEEIAASVRDDLSFNHELMAETIRCNGDSSAGWMSLKRKYKILKNAQ